MPKGNKCPACGRFFKVGTEVCISCGAILVELESEENNIQPPQNNVDITKSPEVENKQESPAPQPERASVKPPVKPKEEPPKEIIPMDDETDDEPQDNNQNPYVTESDKEEDNNSLYNRYYSSEEKDIISNQSNENINEFRKLLANNNTETQKPANNEPKESPRKQINIVKPNLNSFTEKITKIKFKTPDNDSYKKEESQVNDEDILLNIQTRNDYNVALSEISQRDVAIIYFDINNLKLTNDTLGHKYGDKLIVTVVKTLIQLFGNNVYRVGGDEFIVLLDGVGAKVISNKLANFDAILNKYTKKDPDGIKYKCAYGYAIGDGILTKNEIQDKAESEMYKKKKKSKDSRDNTSARKKDAEKNLAYDPNYDGYYDNVIADIDAKIEHITKEQIIRIIGMILSFFILTLFLLFVI